LSVWLYIRWWFAVLVVLLIGLMVAVVAIIVTDCQARGIPFYACGPGG
jgi:hypothetical protein